MNRSEILDSNRLKVQKASRRTKKPVQGKRGKLSPKERLELLFDESAFSQLDMFVKSRSEICLYEGVIVS